MGKQQLIDKVKESLAEIEKQLAKARDQAEGATDGDIDTVIGKLQQVQQEIALRAEDKPPPAGEEPVEELPEEEAPKA